MKHLSRLLFFLLLVAPAAFAQGYIHGNGDPRVTGTDCGRSRFYIDDTTSVMYVAGPGSPCVWTPAGSGAYPGVAADGSNGLAVSGTVAAGTSVSTPQVTITNAPIGSHVLANGAGYTTATPFYTQPGLTLYGDSICAGVGPNFTNQQIGPLLSTLFGQPFTNLCVSGATAADIARLQVFPNTTALISGSPNFLLEGGTNDSQYCGATAACEANYQNAEQASLSNLIIPYTNKVWGYQATTTAGVSFLDTTIPGVNGLASTTNGTTMAFVTPYGGTAVDVVWHASDTWTGVATVTIDGTLVDTISAKALTQNGHCICSANGTTDSPFAKQYTVAAASSHTVVFVITSATGAGNQFSVLYVATPYVTTLIPNPPTGAVSGVFYAHNVSGAPHSVFDAIAHTIEATYQNEGLPVGFINVRAPWMNSTTDFDTVANNISGQVITVATTNGSPAVTVTGASVGPNMAGWPIEILLGGAASTTLDAEVLSVSGSTITLNTNALATNASTTAYLGPPGTVCGPGYGGLHPSNCGTIHYLQAIQAVMQPRTPQTVGGNLGTFYGQYSSALNQFPFFISSFPSISAPYTPMFYFNYIGAGSTAPMTLGSGGTYIAIDSGGYATSADYLRFANVGVDKFRVDSTGNVTAAGTGTFGGLSVTGNPSFGGLTLTGSNITALNITGYNGTGTARPFLCFCYSGATAPTWKASAGAIIGINLGNFDSTADLFDAHNNGGASLFKIDSTGNVFSAQHTGSGFVATAAAPSVAAAQIGYGSTTVAASNCGSLSGAAGCIVVNIAGTVHYVPYW